MNFAPTVSAVVLAAGMSTRMGTLKQLAPFRGKPLLQIALDTLHESAIDEVVLVLGCQAAQITSQLDLKSAKVVLNQAFHNGMATSLNAGISQVSPNAAAGLVVLADHPLLTPDTINRLIAVFLETKPKIAIPTFHRFRGNPVLISRSIFPELKTLVGDIGLRAIFDRYPNQILEVPVDDPGILIDTDTAAELEQARTLDLAKASPAELLSLIDLKGRKLRSGRPEGVS